MLCFVSMMLFVLIYGTLELFSHKLCAINSTRIAEFD